MSDTLKLKLLDLANLKDLNSQSSKNNSYKIIGEILTIAEVDDESDECKMARQFSDEFINTITGISNDILITSDNIDGDPSLANKIEDEVKSEEDEVESTNDDTDDESEYSYADILDEEDESAEEESEEDEDKKKK